MTNFRSGHRKRDIAMKTGIKGEFRGNFDDKLLIQFLTQRDETALI